MKAIKKIKDFFTKPVAYVIMIEDLYQLLTVVKKPGGFRVSYYKTDISCGCQGDLRLVFIPTEKEKMSKAEIVEAIENKECTFLR